MSLLCTTRIEEREVGSCNLLKVVEAHVRTDLLATASSFFFLFLSVPNSFWQEVRIGEKLEESGENVFVGGENKWK